MFVLAIEACPGHPVVIAESARLLNSINHPVRALRVLSQVQETGKRHKFVVEQTINALFNLRRYKKIREWYYADPELFNELPIALLSIAICFALAGESNTAREIVGKLGIKSIQKHHELVLQVESILAKKG